LAHPHRPRQAQRRRAALLKTTDDIYAVAALETGKTVAELKRAAESVFASILLASMRTSGTVWTQSRIAGGRLEIEVDCPPRPPLRRL
jgi:hypothetical protein